LGKKSELIGSVVDNQNGKVVLNTNSGGRRILDIPSGIQLPRIC